MCVFSRLHRCLAGLTFAQIPSQVQVGRPFPSHSFTASTVLSSVADCHHASPELISVNCHWRINQGFLALSKILTVPLYYHTVTLHINLTVTHTAHKSELTQQQARRNIKTLSHHSHVRPENCPYNMYNCPSILRPSMGL